MILLNLSVTARLPSCSSGRSTTTRTSVSASSSLNQRVPSNSVSTEPRHFTGGEIRLYNLGEGPGSDRRIAVPPRQNSLLLFPSWVGHDVTTVSVPTHDFADSRFAVNCWLHRSSPAQ